VSDYKLGTEGSEVKLSACDCSVQQSANWFGREVRTADGRLKRDKIAIKRTWEFQYSWLPGKQARVYDGGMGRDELYTLYISGNQLSLLVPQEDGVTEQVDVYFGMDSWRERLIMEDGAWGKVWEVSFTLIEV
jgi:hypothetical protein